MGDQDKLTEAMRKLMPQIRTSFVKGANRTKLTSVVRVETRESVGNVRLPEPGWPGPSDELVEPANEPDKASRLYRELSVTPMATDEMTLLADVTSFGEETAEAYRRAVLETVASGASEAPPAGPPNEHDLRARAERLGMPCRIVAGPGIYPTIKDLSDPYIEEVVLENRWSAYRILMLPLTSTGPWVEELEVGFLIDWALGGNDAVTLGAGQRLYVHNAESCYLYDS